MSTATEVTADFLRAHPLPQPGTEGDKEARGRALVIGGGLQVPGAVILAGTAALQAGAGKLQIASVRSVAVPLALAVPEARVIALPETEAGEIAPAAAEPLERYVGAAQAVVIGPGMLDEEAAAALTGSLLKVGGGPSILIDAAAMTNLPSLREPLRRHGGRVVITPHAGEMAALLGIPKEEVAADPVAAARETAARLQVVVALKGARTFIVSPQGEAWTAAQGHVGLATSGSGDTLAGIIGGLLARGATPVQAAFWGVYLHGEAGNRLGPLGFLARDIPGEVPAIMAELA